MLQMAVYMQASGRLVVMQQVLHTGVFQGDGRFLHQSET